MLAIAAGVVGLALALQAFQDPFREYPGWEYNNNEYNNFPIPADWNIPGEWTFARLMYPSTSHHIDWQSEYHRGLDWRQGRTNWTIDYPRSDRHLAAAIRRLTRIDVRSVEQPSTWMRMTTCSIIRGCTPWRWATGS